MSSAPRTESSLKILIVDDDELVPKVVRTILARMGISEVLVAQNGTDALGIVGDAGRRPDVILCDLNMPSMDGVELLRHIAGHRFAGGIIVISGVDESILQSTEELAREHGLNIIGSLRKPISPPALADLLATFDGTRIRGSGVGPERISAEELRQGIASGALTVFYQPKVTVADRSFIGAECLARWQHPERGVIGPASFISLAEELSLIDELTEAIYLQSMRQCGAWLAEGLDVKLAVNISVSSLHRLDLPESLALQAAEHGVDASHVMLEITESQLMKEIKQPLEILTRLRLKGIGLSIDDLGTGHSSLEQLRRIPFTELKIDRSFVHGAAGDASARSILESSVDLARKLNMTTVAEGVETEEDWNLIASLGVDFAQGYLIAKPMAADELTGWLDGWTAG